MYSFSLRLRKSQDAIPPEILADLKHATVFIQVSGIDLKASGSGFIVAVDSNGALIATNHMISSAEADEKRPAPADSIPVNDAKDSKENGTFLIVAIVGTLIGLFTAVGGVVVLLNQKIKANAEAGTGDRGDRGDDSNEPDDYFDEDNDRPRGRRR
ncbi:MAG TPA: hypothetical protein VGI99_08205 [Gemmataceae bacterium]